MSGFYPKGDELEDDFSDSDMQYAYDTGFDDALRDLEDFDDLEECDEE